MDKESWKVTVTEMVAARCEEVERLVKQWAEKRAAGEDPKLGEMEIQVREWALLIGKKFMERLIGGIGENSPQQATGCPACRGPVESEGMRFACAHTSMGDIGCQRRYVVCQPCQEGFCPLDQELGLDEQRNTPALQRMVSLAGAIEAFEKGSEVLREIGSIVISRGRVERITEQVGRRVEAFLGARRTRAMAGLEKPDGPASVRLYVEADGTTVPMRPPEEEQGECSEGVKPERSKDQRTKGKVQYKEVKLGAVFDARVDESGEPQIGKITYTGTFGDAEVCAQQVVAEAKARGSDLAQEIVVLGDGGSWIWNRLPGEFAGKKVTQILDWCHPSERLSEVGKSVFGEGTPQAHGWSGRQMDLLYEGSTRAVIEAMEHLKPAGAEASESVRENLGYFREHEHRMNYGELRAQGYFIGSGVIESSCGHIVGDRLKQSGMMWSQEHVPKLLALRVGRASGWWEDFWKNDRRN